jgi:hypothetical protein
MSPFLEDWKMKASSVFCTWRPLVGAAVVGALAIAVSVQGSPRVGGERDKGSGKSQASRVVTGPSAHINSAVAQGAGATISMKPVVPRGVAVQPGGNVGYNAGNIAGNKVTLGGTPSRVWFEWQITGWPEDRTIDPPNGLKTTQVKIAASGFMGSGADCAGSLVPGADLKSAVQSCVTNADCRANISGGVGAPDGSQCKPRPAYEPGVGNICEPTFQDKTDAQWILVGLGGGVASCDLSTANHRCGSTCEPPEISNDSAPSYLANMVIDVPAGAKGLYTIGYTVAETFLKDATAPIALIIVAELIPGQIEIACGSCCFNLGPGTSLCEGGMTAGGCATHVTTNATVFRVGEECPPPDGAGPPCPACTTNLQCADGDACTQDICSAFVCSNPRIPAWTAGTCCEGGTVITPGGCGQCETAQCSGAPDSPDTGTAECAPRTGLGCDDGSACTYTDTCLDGATCSGTPVVGQICTCDPGVEDCQVDSECLLGGAQFPCVDGFCFCTETPDLSVEIDPGGKSLLPGFPVFDENCFESGDDGDKITGRVVVGPFGGDITGGQFQLVWDPTCVELVDVAAGDGFAVVYSTPASGGSMFLAVGVAFATGAVPGGGAVLAGFSFIKIGECNSCEICVDGTNPQNVYLADAEGQRVNVAPGCSKTIKANNEVVLTVPGNIKTNADCNVPTATENWPAPSATDSCGHSQVICRGEHESGANLDDLANGGGEFSLGASTFCCYAVSDYCGKIVGCPPDTNCADNDDNGKSDGCWTVRVNDETSLDLTIGLSPGAQSNPGDTLTRCIKFTLYYDCDVLDPLTFSENVTFGGVNEFIGKSTGKVKIPGSYNWSCITAQDQLHTLRSCDTLDATNCVGGQLKASFYGDPRLGGNWLIAGNLDGWKKDDPNANPSLDVIDILDYGTFVSQYLRNYCDDPLYTACPNTPCGTPGPNADINGDGLVDIDDYAFISRNFLTSSKQCCCGPQTASVNAITEISVAQLRALGLNDLVVADLNGDGLLNLADMAAFDQGVRPSKTVPTKGGARSSGSR